MVSETDLDSILVRQKDRIIRLVNSGNVGIAQIMLDTVYDLWQRCDYGYKYLEIIERIRLTRRQNEVE